MIFLGLHPPLHATKIRLCWQSVPGGSSSLDMHLTIEHWLSQFDIGKEEASLDRFYYLYHLGPECLHITCTDIPRASLENTPLVPASTLKSSKESWNLSNITI